MTNSILSVCFGVCLEEDQNIFKKFPLDEAIMKFSKLFDERGHAVCMEIVFEYIESNLLRQILGKHVEPEPACISLGYERCCDFFRFERAGTGDRRLLTSLGTLHCHYERVRCIGCGLSFVPMNFFLGIEKYQRKSRELIKILIELLIDQSYRRSLFQVSELTGAEMSLSGLWRTVMKSSFFRIDLGRGDLDTLNVKTHFDQAIREWIIKDPLHAILADGTGYKLQNPGKLLTEKAPKIKNLKVSDLRFEKRSNPLLSEVRVVFGVTKAKAILPRGVYTGKESWKTIGKDLRERFGQNPKLKPMPIADLLISDGEEAIFRGLGHLAKDSQRCQWHFTSDLKAVYQYGDQGSKRERQKHQDTVQTIMDNIHDKVLGDNTKDPLEKKLKMEIEIKKAEDAMIALAKYFEENNYGDSAVYIRNGAQKIFSYLKNFLRTGILGAKVTSQLERIMREIGRRIKRIAYNWSPRGAQIMSYLILVKSMNRTLWNSFWKKFLSTTGNLKLTYEYGFMKNQEEKFLH